MLSDKYSSMLTAYVDGELTNRERKAVHRLLKESPEARRLLQQLERDSRELTALPKKTPPDGFTQQVMDKIDAEAAPVSASGSTVPSSSRIPQLPNWVSLALAASVLAAICYGSYLYFSNDSNGNGTTIAVNPGEEGPAEDSGQEGESVAPKLQFALRDVNNKDIKDKLKKELKQETSIHLNLTTNDNTVAAEQLAEVLKSKGIKLLVDDKAEENLKAKKKKMKYVLYVEDLQPNQVEELLSGLAESKSKDSPAVQTVALNPLSSDLREEMAKLLGVDSAELEPAKKQIDLNVKGLPEPVIIPGKKKPGDKDKTAGGESSKKDHLAVMLAYDSTSSAGSSKQIASFLEARQSNRPDGTLQVVILLEQTV